MGDCRNNTSMPTGGLDRRDGEQIGQNGITGAIVNRRVATGSVVPSRGEFGIEGDTTFTPTGENLGCSSAHEPHLVPVAVRDEVVTNLQTSLH